MNRVASKIMIATLRRGVAQRLPDRPPGITTIVSGQPKRQTGCAIAEINQGF
ncbi:MAG: hypothetical protein ACLQHK_09145 [Gallionellaceae bacterium]